MSMTLRTYLVLMLFGILVSFLLLCYIIFYISPKEATSVIYILLYLCIFLVSGGIFFLGNFYFRLKLKNEISMVRTLRLSFRQSLIFAIFATGCLIFKQYDILMWWNLLLIFVCFISIYLFLNHYS